MPKKIQGLWREDEFGDGFPRPKKCPKCKGRELEYERLIDEDEHDHELEEAYEASDLDWQDEGLMADWTGGYDPRFTYSHEYAVCYLCAVAVPYGPRYYYNPVTNNYDLQRPLHPDAVRKIEQEVARQQELNAGQMELGL